jgi:PleD family two-component response regulator
MACAWPGADHPRLILMDIQLPGINGIEALRQLRADAATAAIPVVAVTASAMTQDRQTILAAGFDAYQSKPISVRPFLETGPGSARPPAGARPMTRPHASWWSTTRRSISNAWPTC